jgi:hypothetical protein
MHDSLSRKEHVRGGNKEKNLRLIQRCTMKNGIVVNMMLRHSPFTSGMMWSFVSVKK